MDEEIRPIIKLIFRLALEGHGCPKIASILTEKEQSYIRVDLGTLQSFEFRKKVFKR